ncbi:MAG: hypothetical protein Faunusvirus24_6 [Faunusvirus sp.]|jgi:hypothetical protein|uniref:Uncharacterized protein n=1 Tax=Faunusvirus sp. TaxID=2487766 RepID=A0A3G4ZXK6_9VIRU|nr:MAG: hypothetical protein Faunusvirus24_6 [Faunusvirus sp.]
MSNKTNIIKSIYVVTKILRSNDYVSSQYFGVYSSVKLAHKDITDDIKYLKQPIELLSQSDTQIKTTHHVDRGYYYIYDIINGINHSGYVKTAKTDRDRSDAVITDDSIYIALKDWIYSTGSFASYFGVYTSPKFALEDITKHIQSFRGRYTIVSRDDNKVITTPNELHAYFTFPINKTTINTRVTCDFNKYIY